MKKIPTLHDIDVKNKKVFLRVDFNVPLVNGKIADELRIEAAVPTIEYLLDQNAALILASHLGRPDGKKDAKFSLEPVAAALSEILDRPVEFIDDCIGEEVRQKCANLKSGQIVLLENLRFYEQEEKNDEHFARQLADLADTYVDDAFAAIHRAHASIVGVAELLPAAMGLLVQKEYETLTGLLDEPKRPFMAIIGGAKVSTKIEVLESLIKKADTIVIGGAMANTFLYALGHDMASSVLEADQVEVVKRVMTQARTAGVEIVLPVDLVVASEASDSAAARVCSLDGLSGSDKAFDVGPQTTKLIEEGVVKNTTIFWNGPLGFTEIEQFAKSSTTLAHQLTKAQAEVIIGGGDTASFIDGLGWHDKYDFVSTGGGASLELLAGKKLPGIEVLKK